MLVGTNGGKGVAYWLTIALGFELYCDLVYADWLIQSGTCSKVIFHGKKIPWFVSDVTKKDWEW